jgi:hypothetical protein
MKSHIFILLIYILKNIHYNYKYLVSYFHKIENQKIKTEIFIKQENHRILTKEGHYFLRGKK